MEECILWRDLMHRFRASCSDFDGIWIKRKRLFNTFSVVKSLLHLVANTHQSYIRVMDHLELPCGRVPAASSFCGARSRLPSFVMSELRRDILEASDEGVSGSLWHGYRIHAVDGTRVTLPLELKKNGFKLPGGGHYPQGLVSLLVRLDDRAVCDIRLSKHEDERHEAHEHLAHLTKGDLVVYDRGYLSFALITAHIQQEVGAVFRIAKGSSFLPIEDFWKSEKHESVVIIDPSNAAYTNARKRFPEYNYEPIKLRLIKYKIEDETYVLASTVLNKRISSSDFISLYLRRWTAEETFKTYKQTLELESFHAKSEEGVRQELDAISLLWNLSRILTSMAVGAIKKTLAMLNIIALPGQFSAKCFKSRPILERTFFAKT
jgi:hypothetical protein